MSNPVQQFFTCLFNNDLSGALDLVHDDAVFEAQGPSSVPIYGRFEGEAGVKQFLAILTEMFETEAFEIRKWSVIDEFVFAYGYMQHRVRKTGRIFKSEWALVCQVQGDRIISYKMFEDTAALQTAYV
ncbi:MAG: nuclear transport factor 2 family protein [Microcoleaceae cyanobacterium]